MITVTPVQSGPESNSNERVTLHFPTVLEVEPHHQMQFSIKPRMQSRVGVLVDFSCTPPSKSFSAAVQGLIERTVKTVYIHLKIYHDL